MKRRAPATRTCLSPFRRGCRRFRQTPLRAVPGSGAPAYRTVSTSLICPSPPSVPTPLPWAPSPSRYLAPGSAATAAISNLWNSCTPRTSSVAAGTGRRSIRPRTTCGRATPVSRTRNRTCSCGWPRSISTCCGPSAPSFCARLRSPLSKPGPERPRPSSRSGTAPRPTLPRPKRSGRSPPPTWCRHRPLSIPSGPCSWPWSGCRRRISRQQVSRPACPGRWTSHATRRRPGAPRYAPPSTRNAPRSMRCASLRRSSARVSI